MDFSSASDAEIDLSLNPLNPIHQTQSQKREQPHQPILKTTSKSQRTSKTALLYLSKEIPAAEYDLLTKIAV